MLRRQEKLNTVYAGFDQNLRRIMKVALVKFIFAQFTQFTPVYAGSSLLMIFIPSKFDQITLLPVLLLGDGANREMQGENNIIQVGWIRAEANTRAPPRES